MDYLKQPIMFKIQKVLRYISLFGFIRTFMKVKGQLHLKKRFENLPVNNHNFSENKFIGILGSGNFAYTTIAYFLRKNLGNVIGGCMDIDIHRAASLSQEHHIPFYTTNVNDLLDNDKIKMLYIASYHSFHAEYAIEALKRDKHVYIEKPHIVNEDQLKRLVKAMSNSKGKVFIGFNRPASRFGIMLQKYFNKETGPGMYNWFVGGHDLEPDHWYHNNGEGGRIMGNVCHWTDHILQLVPEENAFPIKITPTRFDTSDVNIAVTYTFNDGTIAVITFAAKGHTFEGVKERFVGYRGNCLITMDDFKTMKVEVIEKKKVYTNFYRDHGHENSIVSAAKNVISNESQDRNKNIAYVWNTGMLVLKTKQALEEDKVINIHSFNKEYIPRKEFDI